jgi:hypothetical protein
MNLSNSIYNASMCIFRKKFVSSLDAVSTYKFCGDWYFWITLALSGKVYINGKILNYYRKHANDVTSKRYIDGSFHKEYLQIQDHLLYKGVNNKKVYIYNLVYHYKTINKFIPNKKVQSEVKNLYYNRLGVQLYVLLFKLFSYNKVKSIKTLFGIN